MGTRRFFTFTTHFDFVNNRYFLKEALRGDMFSTFRVFLSKLFVFVFGSVVAYIFSFKAGECYVQNQVDTSCCRGSEIDEFGREDNCFPVCNRDESDELKEKSFVMETALASSTNKCEFSSGKHISGFMEEQKTMIFSVQELYMDSSDSTNSDSSINLETEEGFDHEKADDYLENVMEKQEEETFTENEESVFTEYKFLRNYDSPSEVPVPYLFQDCSLPIDNPELDKTDSSVVTEGLPAESFLSQATSVMEDKMFDSDDDFIELKPESRNLSVLDEDMLSIDDLIEAKDKHEEKDIVHKETEEVDSVRVSEATQLQNSSILDEEMLSREDLNEAMDDEEKADLVYEATHATQRSEEFEEPSLEPQTEFTPDYDNEDEEEEDDDDEFSLEHQDLIEQLKMELKNARTGGLPTILEESESPKMVEELKPLKFDNKFEYKDRVVEIHKFYRSYLNKMRKLDVLNSQTMHAIGLLKLKEPGQLIKAQKSAVPAIKSLLSQNLWSGKPRKHESNPTLQLIGELHKDFELVYVGHLCLSWEILHWQYRKAFELLEYDTQELRQYNQVAGEFQLFQVLLQRFVENEQFQGGHRVENYVENRRAHCNLLQVPVIREDNLKDRKGTRTDEEDAITNSTLQEIIAESMRVFWEFLRADKDETDVISRGPELHDSIDSEILTDIRTDFQKKEKKLKEILRSSSCIVKRLQKNPEDRLNYGMFLALVELKLVSKVLNMSRLTTDQLVWCHEKLAKFNYSKRKLHLEASFLLFPC